VTSPGRKRARISREDEGLDGLREFLAKASELAEDGLLSLEQVDSRVQGPGLREGAELTAESLPAFAEAVVRKALIDDLQPHLDIIKKEFRSVVPKKLRLSLSWQQVQDRISGKRLDPATFVQEWRDKTSLGSCAGRDHILGIWWEYVSELSTEELRGLFTWCTGFAAIPVTPWKFHIQVVEDIDRCPTINTCMTDDPSAANRGVKMPTMYLPAYECKAILAQKMEWALAGASGLSLC